MSTTATQPQLTLISTDHWLQCWFEQLILPSSRYTNSDIEYVDIATGSFADHVSLVEKALRERPNAVCFACTDCAMEVYSAAVAMIRQEQSEFSLESKSTNIEGANFHCFFLATNKLACRTLVAGCDDLKFAMVRASDQHLPDLGVDGFFKPLDECGSKGVFKYNSVHGSDEAPTPNPQYTTGGTSSTSSEATMVSEPILASLASRHTELNDLLDPEIVGLVEEYVAPESRRVVVSIDGYVWNGNIYHYGISDNVYKEKEGKPEEFSHLVTPSQRLTAKDIEACWEKYDTVANDLVRRGLNNQFLDVEAFILDDTIEGHIVVKTMEVNARTFCNQLPMFSQLFGGNTGFDGCMLSAAVDMLRGIAPPMVALDDSEGASTFSRSILVPVPVGDGTDAGVLHSQQATKVGVCAYLPLVKGCPVLVCGEDVSYYCVPGFVAQVYAIGLNEEIALKLCNDFWNDLVKKYNN